MSTTMKNAKILSKCLRKGDKVAVVTLSAPEAALESKKFEAGKDYLEKKGFKVLVAPHATQIKGYLVGDPQTQVEDLHWAFSNPEIKAIFLAGGGYNANKLLSLIDYNLISKNPKIIIGMSNMSVILNSIWAKSRLVTFYGPAVVHNLGAPEGIDKYSETLLWRVLSSRGPVGKIPTLTERLCLRPGKARGVLIGGNLTSLQSLLGTPYEPDWSNTIFFWEDCFMEIHDLDSVLTHFALAGVFNKVSGMLVGRPLEVEEKEFLRAPHLQDVVTEICSPFTFPILYNLDFGHNVEKATLPIGIEAEMDSDSKTLTILEACTHC